MSRGWGFKIDYAAAIADDDRRIAWAQRSLERGWYRRQWPYAAAALAGQTYEAVELWQLAIRCPDVATAAGLTLQDVADLASSLDAYDTAKRYIPELPDPQRGPALYRRGDELFAALKALSFGGSWLYKDEAAARADLRRARASRARHTRNRETYGRR